jgi:organic hydroperoxide reductase OsmC/OhrA
MSEHIATVHWENRQEVFTDNRYSREHIWKFDGGAEVPASASPYVVRIPYSNPACVDPEEAFIAAIASCHMLFFLAIAAKHQFLVERYTDQAIGHLEKNENGKLAITDIRLHPVIVFAGDSLPTPAQIEEIHYQAHQECFLANSVKTPITILQP